MEGNEASNPQESETSSPEPRKLLHDLLNSLYISGMSIELLENLLAENEEASKILEVMHEEHQNTVRMVRQLREEIKNR